LIVPNFYDECIAKGLAMSKLGGVITLHFHDIKVTNMQTVMGYSCHLLHEIISIREIPFKKCYSSFIRNFMSKIVTCVSPSFRKKRQKHKKPKDQDHCIE
jgi:hypothetical protein